MRLIRLVLSSIPFCLSIFGIISCAESDFVKHYRTSRVRFTADKRGWPRKGNTIGAIRRSEHGSICEGVDFLLPFFPLVGCPTINRGNPRGSRLARKSARKVSSFDLCHEREI